MFTVNDARSTNQLETANKQRIKQYKESNIQSLNEPEETLQTSFPTGTVGPRVRIFLSQLNTNDVFNLSHILHASP